jgi:hypothetical protein
MATDMAWGQNDALFRSQLTRGHHFASVVAERLRAEGLAVDLTPMEWRENIDDAKRFADEIDLTVEGKRVEVKSSSRSFTGPDDWPFPVAFVDTASGWAAKRVRPVAVVCISQPTEGIAVIPMSSEDRWTTKRVFDAVRGIEETMLAAPLDALRSLDDLVAWFKGAR